MTVEIEIKGAGADNEIYDLRNFIQEQEIQGLQVQLKQQPAIDGTMSLLAVAGLIATVAGDMLLETGIKLTLEKPVKKIEHAIKAWLLKRKQEGKKDIEVYTEVQDGQAANSFVTDSAGVITRLNNLNFAIDTRRTRVLLIGNSEFNHNFPAIKPVKGNMEDFYNMLTDKKIIGIPPGNITIAFNKTSGEIEEQLLLVSKLPDVETLIIYYAGHGYKADAKKLYLVASNSKKIDDHIISAVDFDFIKNVILKQSVASQKIVILDACHSGIATQGADDFLTNFDVKGTYIFTSSSGDEVSYFNTEKRNTFFTAEMINVFNNGLENFHERITLKDIYESVAVGLKEKNFPEPRQKSELNIPLSNFYIARNLKFSVDKWKQKAKQLFITGRVDEAEQEYNRLLLLYPDDEFLKAEVAQNKIERNYLSLLGEAEDHFEQQEYEKALEKYDAALLIRQEFSVMSKRNKCAEYFELKRKILDKNGGRVDKPVIIKAPPKKNEPTVKDLQEKTAPAATAGTKAWVYIICIVWLFLYFLSIKTTIDIWEYFSECDTCYKPLHMYAELYIFLVLPALLIFLLLRRNKWGWMLALLASALKIAELTGAAFQDYNHRYGEEGISTAFLVFTAVHLFLIFILSRRAVRNYYDISSKHIKQSVIASIIIAILYIITAWLQARD